MQYNLTNVNNTNNVEKDFSESCPETYRCPRYHPSQRSLLKIPASAFLTGQWSCPVEHEHKDTDRYREAPIQFAVRTIKKEVQGKIEISSNSGMFREIA